MPDEFGRLSVREEGIGDGKCEPLSMDMGAPKHVYRREKRKMRTLVGVVTDLLLVGLAILWLLPIVGIVVESFRCTGYDPALGTVSFRWGMDNYVRLFRETHFVGWFLNTLLVGTVTAVLQTVLQLSTGYVLSRFRFRGRTFLMWLLLFLGMIPACCLQFALVLILREWHLTGENAPIGTILVYSASSGVGYAVAKKFFDTVDRSLVEVARVCGASEVQIFFKVFLPLAKPVVIYTLLMGFLLPWNTFSVTEPTPGGYLVADGLTEVLGSDMPDAFPTFCAGGVVVSVPIAILLFFLLKYYIFGETLRNFRT